MTEEKILLYAIGALVSILIYMAKNVISDIKYLKLNDSKQDTNIEVMKTNHDNLHDSVSELKSAIRELSRGIDNLTNKLIK